MAAQSVCKVFELAAEVAHVVRPLAHLSAVGLCGRSSWTPWLMAAGLDVASLQVLSRTRASLQPPLRALGDSVPLLGWITRPLADYIPEWQNTYCHNWAS
ncbi:hypothetical protein MTO96_031336 [Rhipicephalus appendiculatus]